MSSNITRSEAQQRGQELTVDSYQVDLDLTLGDETFRSSTLVKFSANCTESWIDLLAPSVELIELNGVSLDPATFDGSRIPLPNLHEENALRVEATCAYMHTGEGLHRFVDPVDDSDYLYTQFETADARRMYACFEQPDLKATFQLSVTAPDKWLVLSNSPTPEPVSLADNANRWEFAPTQRVSTYITALVAGPYHRVEDRYEGAFGAVPLGVYCRASLAEFLDADEILTVAKEGFAFFEGIFGREYPFEKYDQIFVPDFNAGAMENAGCVTFREDLVFRSRVTLAAYDQRANTILHELSHMWFGDLVTMKWWDDLWLNESFAEWAAHHAQVEATRYTDAWTSFATQRKAWAYRQDQLPSTHPIAADMVDLDSVRVNFDGITYAKGASALKQLVAYVGEENFLSALRNYFTEFAWSNTERDDLFGHLEQASGRDLSHWTTEWLQTSGVNLLSADIQIENGKIAKFIVNQGPPTSPPGLPPTLRSHRIGIGIYHQEGEALNRTKLVQVDVVGAQTEVPELVGVAEPDLALLNDLDLTFAKIRLDPKSTATATQSLGQIDDSLARTLIWGAAWDMTRDAEMSCGEYVQLAQSGLAKETDVVLIQSTIRQVRVAVDQFAAPQNRDRYANSFANSLWEWAREAEAGSDQQLAYFKGFLAFAATTEQLQVVEEILNGQRSLPALLVDTDLRWSILQTLAATGAIGQSRIEAEAEIDQTATGRRHRALALAALPSAETKAEAWRLAVEDASTSNSIVEAILGGFAQRDQEDLLAEYVDKFFATVPDLWQSRTPETAQSLTMLLYPYMSVSQETIDKANSVKGQEGLHPAAVRLLSEGADSTRRALAARECDASV